MGKSFAQGKKKVIVVGAGPGGLSSAMVLAARGFDVTIHEKEPRIGGRCSAIKENGYTFDLGPTFVMLTQTFREVFELSGKRIEDYMELIPLDPLYKLHYKDGREFTVHYDKEKLRTEIERLFPGDSKGYDRYLKEQGKKFDVMYPCLKVHYDRWYHYLRPKLIRAFPYMDNFTSIYDVLSRYFTHEDMRIAMTFQAKYLGMSPWTCPGAFTILSYVEHAFGVFHVKGGVHMLCEGMAKAVTDLGATIKLSSPIKRLIVEGGRVQGVVFADGREERADAVIMNADFAHGMKELVAPEYRPRTTDKKLDSYEYSCSTYMLYLGIDGDTGHLPHHNIFFSGDYKKNIEQIFAGKLPEDPSFYIQNASVTDTSLAPKGKSTLYVLVPVPNRASPLDWTKESGPLRERILDAIEKRAGITNIRGRIEVERIVTPLDWEQKASVFRGAVFNLAHTIGQMLYLRPHNRFEEIPGLYVAGGGTHPGSGLPTIVESGRIVADLICEDYK